MDLKNIIIGTGLLMICLLPFIFSYYKRKKSERELKQSMSDFAAKQQCELVQFDISNDLAFGMDRAQYYLFFAQRIKTGIQVQSFEITQYVDCEIIKNLKENTGIGQFGAIASLELCLKPKNTAQPQVKLTLFDANDSAQMTGEWQLANEWSSIIKNRIQFLPL